LSSFFIMWPLTFYSANVSIQYSMESQGWEKVGVQEGCTILHKQGRVSPVFARSRACDDKNVNFLVHDNFFSNAGIADKI
jgi:hypothetical protein